MIAESSATGLFRTLLIIVGVIVLLRFIGQFLNAKKNMEEERAMNARKKDIDKEKERKRKSEGKTNIIGDSDQIKDIEDVDFEELDS